MTPYYQSKAVTLYAGALLLTDPTELINGQFPLTACAAFIFGRYILASCHN